MESKSLSIVLATYNGGAYLQDQLDSIMHQTRRPDEVVVGDDSSGDNSVKIVESFARKAPFAVRFLQHDRVGYSTNFLLTLEASQGELVAFADQDDIWLPDKLERSLEALHRYGAVLVTHGARTVDHNLQPVRTGHRGVRRTIVYDRLQPNVWPYAWPGHSGNSMLFRRGLLEGCDWRKRPPNAAGRILAHDELVHILASIRGRSVYLPDKLLLYRQHNANTCGAPPNVVRRWRSYAKQDLSLLFALEGQARLLDDWANYFLELVELEHRHETAAYFSRAAAVISQRAERLQLPPSRAVGATLSAAIRGQYARLAPEGLGWGTLPRDLFYIGRQNFLPKSRREQGGGGG